MNAKAAVTNPIVEEPLESFANCHQGIISKLDAFGELPALLGPVARACALAQQTTDFFRGTVFDHHREEEKDLFPAVLEAANAGAERTKVKRMVDALVAEHREIESIWRKLEPAVEQLAKGRLAEVDGTALANLVQQYHRHAQLEEERFLPLAHEILGRKDSSMAGLGLALHTRHVVRAARRGLRGS